MTGLRPLGSGERELLLTCARTELSATDAARASRLAATPLDWEAVVEHARLHSVAPLLRTHLRDIDRLEACPRPARADLLALAHRAAWQNARFAAENRDLLEAFAAAGIRVAVPKGLSVAAELYGGISRRPLIDLVFLVPADRMAEAERMLLGRGYVTEPQKPVEATYRWAFPQVIASRHGEVTIKTVLLPNIVNWPRVHRVAPEELMDRLRFIDVQGTRTPVLGVEDLVLYLCLQVDNHGHFNRVAAHRGDAGELVFAPWSNNRLVRLVDLREAIIRHGPVLNWELLADRARSYEIDGAVRASLTLTGRALGLEPPPRLLDRRSGARRHPLRAFLYAGLDGARPPGPRRGSLAHLAASGWSRAGAAWQIRLGRLLGLAELALPGARFLRQRHGNLSGPALAALGAGQFGRVLLRSLHALAVAVLAESRSHRPKVART